MRLATSLAAPVTRNSTKVTSATPKLRGASMISTATTSPGPATPQSAHFNVSHVPPLPTKLSAEPAIPPVHPVPAIPANFTEPTPTRSHDDQLLNRRLLQSPCHVSVSRRRCPYQSQALGGSLSTPSWNLKLVWASYSDDEYKDANETENVKQRRRQSKDDIFDGD
ncbi:hypothetical protein M378DRAFT_465591 [Amanita muscaria Koide BX008]|uniref:Uncharacterized protein n=1 Tax=Amanita muscaria (strain Koide BX008) TaxID=946122 RepID=A0A0C2WK70_AMAMK|nr:hypothetical protein M378DRAFT_465591 [Amanita muscaria Koide BX008]